METGRILASLGKEGARLIHTCFCWNLCYVVERSGVMATKEENGMKCFDKRLHTKTG